MRKWILRTTVALLSFTIGVSVSRAVRSLTRPRPVQAAITPAPVEVPVAQPLKEAPAEYPDEYDLSPWQIEYFIDSHPEANLERLWKRLRVSAHSKTLNQDFTICNLCNAESFEYDLDDEPGYEIVLKISQPFGEAFRYLIFKYAGGRDRKWKVIGDIDEWGKYKDSQHMVVLGKGRPLLLTQGQGASGSGVSLFFNRVFLVSTHGVKQILSFPSDGHQSAWPDGLERDFAGQLASYSLQNGRIELTVQFQVRYEIRSSGDIEELFSKTQTAVYSGTTDRVSLQRHESTISEREIEHIYNIDSMTDNDFLKYNYSELLYLANHGNQKHKSWLKTYLQTFGNSAEKRMLLGAIRK